MHTRTHARTHTHTNHQTQSRYRDKFSPRTSILSREKTSLEIPHKDVRQLQQSGYCVIPNVLPAHLVYMCDLMHALHALYYFRSTVCVMIVHSHHLLFFF